MIFRRSLVRELTATAIGLFLVLLAILFTNLVLRMLARAAGGAVAPDGILALLGFNALFYFNILLSVALFLTVLLTLSRWYRDSEMIVWFTSGQSLDRLPAADPAVRRAVPGRDRRCCRCSCRRGPSSASSNTSGSSSRATKSRCLRRACSASSRAPNLVVFVESINPLDGTIRNVFLHSVDDKQGRDHRRARSGTLEEQPNGDRFIVLEDGRRYEGKPGTADYRVVEFEQARPAHRARRGRARCPTSTQGDPDRGAAGRSTAASSAPSCSGASRCRSRRWC